MAFIRYIISQEDSYGRQPRPISSYRDVTLDRLHLVITVLDEFRGHLSHDWPRGKQDLFKCISDLRLSVSISTTLSTSQDSSLVHGMTLSRPRPQSLSRANYFRSIIYPFQDIKLIQVSV